MVAKYNLELYVEKKPCFVPEKAYLQTIELFKKVGIVGRFNVNHFGRIFPGYDDSCELFRRGEFNFAPRDIEETSVEMLESWSPVTEAGEELKAHAEECLETLAKIDPSIAILPWNIYRQFPIINSMELLTPYGRQSVHFHTDDDINFGVIQLWRPRKDKFWYDLDYFKSYLINFWSKNFDDETDSEEKLGFFTRLKIAIKKRRTSKLCKLYEKMILDPDSIERVPSFIN